MDPSRDEELHALLQELYPEHDVDALREDFRAMLQAAAEERSPELRAWEERRAPGWAASQDHVVYVCYADLFTRDFGEGPALRKVVERLGWLEDLGVTNLHLLPIFPTSGDGGFAIDDYRAVRDDLGTMEDLRALCAAAHARGVAITVDFVLNHTSDRHPWAEAARRWDEHYLDYFLRDETGTGEPWPGVPDVFPDFAPGHWDWVPDLGAYVWATFYARQPRREEPARNEFGQWDLNYRNPNVLRDMVETMLFLLNQGVDCLRLDAIPFLWKNPGTICTSQPELYRVLRVICLCLEEVAPRVALLAEANDQLPVVVEYFGTGPTWGHGVDLAYGFPAMPLLWYAVAFGDAEPLMTMLTRLPQLPDGCGWLVFDEVHDEVSLEALEGAFPGPKGRELTRRLFEYFTRDGRGVPFRFDPQHAEYGHGISSNRFTMLGGEAAVDAGDDAALEKVYRRISLLEGLKASLGGPTLVYAGQEVGLETDWNYVEDPVKAPDSRFAKRRVFPREAVDRVKEEGTPEREIWTRTREILRARKGLPALAGTRLEVLATGRRGALAYLRPHAEQPLYALFNVSEEPVEVSLVQGLWSDPAGPLRDVLDETAFARGEPIPLEGLSFRWLVGQAG